jgi:uncharacterized membrane protein YeaQ/YmgE (transglycosylase-associated protein family)
MAKVVVNGLILGLISGFLIGKLASRKNRNGWLWGIIFGAVWPLGHISGELGFISRNAIGNSIAGAFYSSWIIAMITLAFLPYLCPKCKEKISKKQWKEKICPRCGKLEESKDVDSVLAKSSQNKYAKSVSSNIRYCPSCQTEIKADSIFCEKCGDRIG